MIEAACCGTPRSQRIDLIYKSIFPASHAAMNSASVEDNATAAHEHEFSGCNILKNLSTRNKC